jgi:CHAT domain-containing protein
VATRFGKPIGETLTPDQQTVVGAILKAVHAPEYNVAHVRASVTPFVAALKNACRSDDERQEMIAELERWIRWERVSAYWLTYVFQKALERVASRATIVSRRLYADALININDDMCLLSLESALVAAREINVRHPSDDISAAFIELAEYIHRVDASYREWYSTRPYTTIEPLSEHLYNLRVMLDLKTSFPELTSEFTTESAGDPVVMMGIVQACAADEVYLRVVARRCAGWAYEFQEDTANALKQYQLAFDEAAAAGLETETCHILRYAANVWRRAGRLNEAELDLQLALRLESHLELSYWRALTARELGRVLSDYQKTPGPNTAAMTMYEEGRESFDTGTVSSVVPVARAVKQQMFRAYADDAIAVACYARPLDLLSEIEAAGPRYATDIVVESKFARDLPAEEQASFRRARAVFAQNLALFAGGNDDDQGFIAYLDAVIKRNAVRQSYVATRRRLGRDLVAEQRSTWIAEGVFARKIPDVSFLVFHLAEKHTYAIFIDKATGRVLRESIAVGIDYWRTFTDTYHAALAGALASDMRRAPLLEAAIGSLVTECQQTLAPLIERFLPIPRTQHLKIVPRLGLSEVPIHALSVGGKPLIGHCDVSYVPTLGAYLAIAESWPQDGSDAAGPLTIVHDTIATPAYAGTLRAIQSQTKSGAEIVSPMTCEAFWSHVAASPPADIFFACHGRFDVDDPRNSALQLKLRDTSEKLTFVDLFSDLNLARCRSVLMGACESGLGRTLVAAEYVGLPLAFLAGGVRYVIGTLWQVNQIASAILVARHYELVAGGNFSVPQALNEAQRYTMRLSQDDVVAWLRAYLPERAAALEPAIRKLNDAPYAHPYYWAGFYLTGDT